MGDDGLVEGRSSGGWCLMIGGVMVGRQLSQQHHVESDGGKWQLSTLHNVEEEAGDDNGGKKPSFLFPCKTYFPFLGNFSSIMGKIYFLLTNNLSCTKNLKKKKNPNKWVHEVKDTNIYGFLNLIAYFATKNTHTIFLSSKINNKNTLFISLFLQMTKKIKLFLNKERLLLKRNTYMFLGTYFLNAFELAVA